MSETSSPPRTMDWLEANQHYLQASLGVLRRRLEALAGDGQPAAAESVDGGERTAAPEFDMDAPPDLTALATDMQAPPALITLGQRFGLTAFELQVILLCAGIELDSAFRPLVVALQGEPHASFSLALAVLADAHWSAITPNAPLRLWRLVELSSADPMQTGEGYSLTRSPLRIDERILHYLTGIQGLDERLAGLVEPVERVGPLAAAHNELAEHMARIWSNAEQYPVPPILQLSGDEPASARQIAAETCVRCGLSLWSARLASLPVDSREVEAFIRLWERESALSQAALLIDCSESETSGAVDPGSAAALAQMINGIFGPLFLVGRLKRQAGQRHVITFEVHQANAGEQAELWRQVLGPAAQSVDGLVENLTAQFHLSSAAIFSAGAGLAQQGAGEDLPQALWDACCVQARQHMDGLAQRIETRRTWQDIVLPEAQMEMLKDIASHARHQATVNERWGFAANSSRGLGISALFTGPSGTGKTLAAEVLANELRLDLYRIDLSQVVSKYIGETEKNLQRVFAAAETGGAVLLFDEADALFGKRSEVKDSHDRYANIEISYLLQRMEAYRGLAILTTNMKSALDAAFMRRLRFVINFPFPDAVLRQEIWQRIFPPQTPTLDLDPARLAQLNLAGGNIYNIALNAAFLAAEAGSPVTMAQILQAARSEYAKLEITLGEWEVAGWK